MIGRMTLMVQAHSLAAGVYQPRSLVFTRHPISLVNGVRRTARDSPTWSSGAQRLWNASVSLPTSPYFPLLPPLPGGRPWHFVP
ncbi:MAG: hypothetical protein ACI841_000872 [Planctomycetota bacterium]|jgi:hypothetical protein